MAKMLPDQEQTGEKQEFSGGNIKKIFIFSVGHLLDRGGYNDRDRSGNRKLTVRSEPAVCDTCVTDAVLK